MGRIKEIMKKYFIAFQCILLLCNACNVLQVKQKEETDKPAPKRVSLPPANPLALYTKYYKFKTGQSYIRAVERSYYGKQTDMQAELTKYDIKKGFNIEQYIKYPKASFFQTDVYEIPADVKSKAIALFEPLLDTLFLSVDPKKNFHAEILVLGYTDETAVPINTPIYNQLLTMCKQNAFYNNDYYNALSYYRAKEVGDIISTLIQNKKNSFTKFDKASIDIIVEGRGIEYPDAKRTYELEDDKRKITKVYWKVY